MTVRQRPEGGKSMNKYELTLVVNAKIEDDERAAAVEKAKEIITRFGAGTASGGESHMVSGYCVQYGI